MTSGFDEAKLTANLDALLGGWVSTGVLPCVQAVVHRHGTTAYSRSFGVSDLDTAEPLADDAIFRIFSMTKVFTSVSALMLLEEGRYKMHDPLSAYFPEFAHMQVAETGPSGEVRLVPARREIIVRDLFTMATGWTYPGESCPTERALTAALYDNPEAPMGPAEFLTALAGVPLAFHPGEHWRYGFSIDVLGCLVAHLSGQTLGEFMYQRIFEPLGLVDTGFYLPVDKVKRLVTMYDVDDAGAFTPATFGAPYTAPPALEGGGGGLVSTVADVTRFARMLLGEGELDGVRLLSRKSVELMRTNHLTPQQLADYTWDTQRGYGYGLGVRVMMHPEIAGYGTVGEFAWDGLAGTWFAIDPTEDLVAVLMVQTNPGRHYRFIPLYAGTVYGAIAD